MNGHPHLLADVLRVLFVLVPGGATFAVTLVVLFRYARIYRMMRADGGWLGLLPRHVVLVSASYLLLLGWGLADTAHYFHHPLTDRFYVYAAAAVTGLVALWDVLGYETHRKHRM